MTAGEEEAQPLVAHGTLLAGVVGGCALLAGALAGERRRLVGEARAPAQAVDRLVPRRLHDPGARVLRHARGRPLLDGERERLLRRLLRHVEVADETDERGQDAEDCSCHSEWGRGIAREG